MDPASQIFRVKLEVENGHGKLAAGTGGDLGLGEEIVLGAKKRLQLV